MKERPQQLPNQTISSMIEKKLDSMNREVASFRADTAAYHRDVDAILKNQQLLLAAVMPYVVPQMAAAGNWGSASPTTEVCVAPSTSLPPPSRAEETPYTSEDEDVEQIIFTSKSSR
ncbi:hypothetical protein NDU88_004447 [Pleurodeles waltl]|uniref:Uncharacterized protein n=1 Tax=Pleurodeles waltl TaxID=8319 RepID=A0AAV7T7Z7_PLEWA|nr:hypothetical protein NDU88_004447 [Pleurodeles waltl]